MGREDPVTVPVVQELRLALYWVYRELVPPPEDRIPLTWRTLPSSCAYLLPLLFMAYLVRRRDTHLIRLLLLPAVLTLAVRCAFRYMLEGPAEHSYGKLLVLFPLTMSAKAIDFAFAKEGRFKVGEKRLRAVGEPAFSPAPVRAHISGAGTDSDSDSETESESEPPSLKLEMDVRRPTSSKCCCLPEWLHDAIDIMCSFRGIGWDFGQGAYLPQSSRPQERGPFLKATIFSLLQQALLFDLLDSVAKCIPGVGDLGGGSIFFPALPPFYRYAVSTAIHALGGCMIMTAFSLGVDVSAAVGVGLLGHAPSAYPPMHERPFASSSLHAFWARRWHQLLRHTFLTYGRPGQWAAGGAGRLVGAFVASGLFHEIGLQCADHRVVLFFGLQPLGLLLEKAWRRATGRRVGGVLGWVWTALWILGVGQLAMDAWARLGLAGSLLVPEAISPVRRVLWPALRSVLPVHDVSAWIASLMPESTAS